MLVTKTVTKYIQVYEVKKELKNILKNPTLSPSAHKKVYRGEKGGLKMFLVFKKKIIRWIYFVTFFLDYLLIWE